MDLGIIVKFSRKGELIDALIAVLKMRAFYILETTASRELRKSLKRAHVTNSRGIFIRINCTTRLLHYIMWETISDFFPFPDSGREFHVKGISIIRTSLGSFPRVFYISFALALYFYSSRFLFLKPP